MILGRRSVLAGITCALSMPAIVKASGIMSVKMFRPVFWGDGVHDDAPALQWEIDHAPDNGTFCVPKNGTYIFRSSLYLWDRKLKLDFSDSHVVGSTETDSCLRFHGGDFERTRLTLSGGDYHRHEVTRCVSIEDMIPQDYSPVLSYNFPRKSLLFGFDNISQHGINAHRHHRYR